MTKLKSRREFLGDSVGLALVCCGIGTVALTESCTTTKQLSYAIKQNNLVIPRLELEPNSIGVVDDKGMMAPIFVRKISEDEFSAHLLLCTHKGCDVLPTGAILTCPCHGSEFSVEGKVLKGPATQELVQYETSSDNENIYIKIEEL